MRSVATGNPAQARSLPAVLLLTSILLAAVILRLALIDRELWLDETHSAFVAALPPSRMLAFVRGDVHPPLYFLLLSGWTTLVGNSPLALRALSIAVSLAAIVTIYLAGTRLIGHRTGGLLAAAFLAIHPVLLRYSVEVRMYVLAVLLFSLMLYLLPRPGQPPTAGRTVAMGLTALAACLTHYMALFAVAGALLFLVTEAIADPRRWTVAIILGLIVGFGFLPWIPTLLHQRELKRGLRAEELEGLRDPEALSYQNTASLPRPLSERLLDLAQNAASTTGMAGPDNLALALVAGVPIMIAGAAILLLALEGASASRLLLLVWGSLLVGCLLIGATARRFMLLAVPVWALAIAELLVNLWAARYRRLCLALGGTLTLTFVIGAGLLVRSRPSRPIQRSVAHLASLYESSDLVVFNAAYFEVPFSYYAHRRGFEPRTEGFPIGIRDWWLRQEFKGWGGPVIREGDLARFTEHALQQVGTGTLWLVLFETVHFDPRGRLEQTLKQRGREIVPAFEEDGVRVLGFRFATAPFDSQGQGSGNENPRR